MPGTGNRTLFVRLGSLGDVVLTEAAVRAWRRARPGDEIRFLTKERYREVAALFEGVDGVVTPGPGRLTLARLGALLAAQRREGYGTVVDLQGNIRSLILSAGLGAPSRARWPKAALRRRLMTLGHGRDRGVAHVSRRYLATLGLLGVEADGTDPRPRIQPGADLRERAVALLREAGWDGGRPLVALLPGARWPAKRWPAASYAAAALVMERESGARCVLLGDPADGEITGQVRFLCPQALDLTGRTGLAGLAGVLAECDLAVTNDSGPMHLAAAVGTRVLAVFGPTTPGLGFAPLGPGDIVLQADLPCRPCSVHGSRPCRREGHPCMAAVDPAELAREGLRALAVGVA